MHILLGKYSFDETYAYFSDLKGGFATLAIPEIENVNRKNLEELEIKTKSEDNIVLHAEDMDTIDLLESRIKRILKKR